MKSILFLGLLSMSACAAPSVKTEEAAKPKEPVKAEAPKVPPIVIQAAPTQLASIDPTTLKVTYTRGGDPKAVVDQLVRSWAAVVNQLEACRTELAKKK